MLSINTNLQSLIVQNNLTKSSNTLNQAIERMTTGFKLNHASDNAAGYSISKNMSSQLSSYDVAATNISMGIDMMNTAQDTISLMQEKGERLMALWTQAQNGTYGAQSLEAINQEAQALVSEINRLYDNAEYNGISLFNNIEIPDWAEEVKANAGYSEDLIRPAFKKADFGKIDDSDVNELEHVSDITNFESNKKYAVSTVADLKNLAALVNSGKSTRHVSFYMGADIDLGNEEWTPIGDSEHFSGIFDGNGHKITGLKIDKETGTEQGLFGIIEDGVVQNLYVEGNVNGASEVGVLAGVLVSSEITNCYIEGNAGNDNSGGPIGVLAGYVGNTIITDTYTLGSTKGQNSHATNDFIGYDNGNSIMNSGAIERVRPENYRDLQNGQAYAISTAEDFIIFMDAITNSTDGEGINFVLTSDIDLSEWGSITYFPNVFKGTLDGQGHKITGISGEHGLFNVIGDATVKNLILEGSINGETGRPNSILAGIAGESKIENCKVSGSIYDCGIVGGLVGVADSNTIISNCSSSCNLTNKNSEQSGGIVGLVTAGSTVSNCFSSGNIQGGNLAGGISGLIEGYSTVSNCFFSGSVSGNFSGGLTGAIDNSSTISSSYTNSTISGNTAGMIIGGISPNTKSQDCFGTGLLNNNRVTENIDENGNSEIQEAEGVDFQVGVNGDSSSRISCDTSLSFSLNIPDISSASAYNAIQGFLDELSTKATEIGAVSNRLESALESTNVVMENLTSSLSTIRDADIAKESSQYIKAQILQQASATLLAAANQTPSLTIQLLNGLG